ncbi:hypothetical protein [Paeniglutamicibacter kerguelensis]|uniref:GNAT family N-acetyltransferase n=1 Tax=Paeniglutamicibacter kerguelensis TaxID=254788 RepID=A0ABS4XAL6_9MICC|nr:hypothetical protein [Paeniglutamicibacter kerguelensis]MBP2385512.1 hypothetical protein [Paeniglutamicibacter kerguelensis]
MENGLSTFATALCASRVVSAVRSGADTDPPCLYTSMALHTSSRMVMERCGMTLVRHFRAEWPVRIDGNAEGGVEYAINLAGRPAGRPKPRIPR